MWNPYSQKEELPKAEAAPRGKAQGSLIPLLPLSCRVPVSAVYRSPHTRRVVPIVLSEHKQLTGLCQQAAVPLLCPKRHRPFPNPFSKTFPPPAHAMTSCSLFPSLQIIPCHLYYPLGGIFRLTKSLPQLEQSFSRGTWLDLLMSFFRHSSPQLLDWWLPRPEQCLVPGLICNLQIHYIQCEEAYT